MTSPAAAEPLSQENAPDTGSEPAGQPSGDRRAARGEPIELRKPLHKLRPTASWSDRELVQWANDIPYHATVADVPGPDMQRYHDVTARRLGNGVNTLMSLALSYAIPLVIAGVVWLATHMAFLQPNNHHWIFGPLAGLLAAFGANLAGSSAVKGAMAVTVFGRATISIRDRKDPGLHRKKITTHYPRLSKLMETGIHQGPAGKGGVAHGSITIPVYLGETLDQHGNVITEVSQIERRHALSLPAEQRHAAWMEQGFTTRITRAIYGHLHKLEKAVELEEGIRNPLAGLLREAIGWLPAILIWTLITISMFSGFSVNAMVADFVSSAPDGVKQLLDETVTR